MDNLKHARYYSLKPTRSKTGCSTWLATSENNKMMDQWWRKWQKDDHTSALLVIFETQQSKKIVASYFVFISPKTRQEDERSGEEEWKNVQVVRIYNNKEGSRKQKMLILRQSHARKNNKPDFPPVPNSSLNPTHCPTFFLCPTCLSFENDQITGITQNARNYPIFWVSPKFW